MITFIWGSVLLNLAAVSIGLYVCVCLPALWAYHQMYQLTTFAGDISKRTHTLEKVQLGRRI